MAKENYSSNINPKRMKEFVNGKCSDEYKGENYKKIQDGNAPDLDMSIYLPLPDLGYTDSED